MQLLNMISQPGLPAQAPRDSLNLGILFVKLGHSFIQGYLWIVLLTCDGKAEPSMTCLSLMDYFPPRAGWQSILNHLPLLPPMNLTKEKQTTCIRALYALCRLVTDWNNALKLGFDPG
eukprot:scaffold312770_cov13-Tisochrysis_lutea.AAC.1